jgi:TetR/AcrR family transcriptional repressor of nem operon
VEVNPEMTKGDRTRQRIIETAAPLFNQHGFAGASMQDVMEAAGLEKGGLYRHFSSKEELAVEAFKFALGQSIRLRTQDLGHTRGSIAKLHYLVCRFVEAPSAVPGGCPLMNTAIDSDDGNPALRRQAAEGLRNWKTRVGRIVEDGLRNGEIRPETEPRQIANTMIAALEGALMISRLEGDREALRDAGASLAQMIDGIAAG